MRKSKTVSKYNLNWQLIRNQNKRLKTVEEKLNNVINFYSKYKCYANWERVYNYLEGLIIGYKKYQLEEKFKINQCMKWFQENKSDSNLDVDVDINEASLNDIEKLYNDLYTRNKQWLKNNYKNRELNIFLKKLYEHLTDHNYIVPKNFDVIITSPSTHKFLY